MLAGVWCGRGTTGGAGAPRTDGRWVRSWYTNMARKARAAALPMIRKMRIKATVRFPLPALQLGGHVGRGRLSAVGEKVNRSCLVELTVLTRRVVTLPPDRDPLARERQEPHMPTATAGLAASPGGARPDVCPQGTLCRVGEHCHTHPHG